MPDSSAAKGGSSGTTKVFKGSDRLNRLIVRRCQLFRSSRQQAPDAKGGSVYWDEGEVLKWCPTGHPSLRSESFLRLSIFIVEQSSQCASNNGGEQAKAIAACQVSIKAFRERRVFNRTHVNLRSSKILSR
jgi:hypothetical protein